MGTGGKKGISRLRLGKDRRTRGGWRPFPPHSGFFSASGSPRPFRTSRTSLRIRFNNLLSEAPQLRRVKICLPLTCKGTFLGMRGGHVPGEPAAWTPSGRRRREKPWSCGWARPSSLSGWERRYSADHPPLASVS